MENGTEEELGPREVRLGKKMFTIEALTLKALKQIGIGAAKQRQGVAKQRLLADDWSKGEAEWYEGTYFVIANGLRITVEDLEKMEDVTLSQLAAAANKIFEITGLTTKKEPGSATGEAAGVVTG